MQLALDSPNENFMRPFMLSLHQEIMHQYNWIQMEKIYATQIQTITTFSTEINLWEYEYISQETIVVLNEPNKLGDKVIINMML